MIAVELTYEDRLLSGTVAGVPLELFIDLPISAGSTRGTFGADLLAAAGLCYFV